MITVNINGAIAHYNNGLKSGKKKMTTTSLALKVFADDARMKDGSKISYLSKWAAGTELSRCDLNKIKTICDATGFTLTDLIKGI